MCSMFYGLVHFGIKWKKYDLEKTITCKFLHLQNSLSLPENAADRLQAYLVTF